MFHSANSAFKKYEGFYWVGNECANMFINGEDWLKIPTLDDCKQLCLDHEACDVVNYKNERENRLCVLRKCYGDVPDPTPVPINIAGWIGYKRIK